MGRVSYVPLVMCFVPSNPAPLWGELSIIPGKQGLTNTLPSCPGQVQILAGQVIFYFTCPEKMYRIYREYFNSEPFSRCCGMPGKWLKFGFVRPWASVPQYVPCQRIAFENLNLKWSFLICTSNLISGYVWQNYVPCIIFFL